MPGTLKEKATASHVEWMRLLVVALRYDDALHPPARLWPWDGEKLLVCRGDRDGGEPGRLLLGDPRVSTTHAELSLTGAQTLVTDLGSSNGTFVNGERAEGPTPLEDGDRLEVGRTLLVYRHAPASLTRPLLPEREQPAGASFGGLRTLSPELADVYRRLEKIAPSGAPILVIGETGAGKDVMANELHRASGRSGPFVAVDCGAIPDNLIESTLFGHEKGAFTGATEARVGEVSRAHRGTLFLDEVGNLTAAGQAKLLRVLETGKVTPVGASKPQAVDVRWVSATNRALMEKDDAFRADLLHRLAGFVVELPPLRERREDLGLLIAALLAEAGVKRASLTLEAGRLLGNHALDGNIRQLRNVLRRVAEEGAEVEIGARALGLLERAPAAAAERGTEEASDAAHPRGWTPDREALEAALIASRGNVAEAARALGTYSRQLYRWLGRAGIDPEAFREGAPKRP